MVAPRRELRRPGHLNEVSALPVASSFDLLIEGKQASNSPFYLALLQVNVGKYETPLKKEGEKGSFLNKSQATDCMSCY